MTNGKPSKTVVGLFERDDIVRKFFVAMLTIAVLSGAVLVTYSRPSAAHGYGGSPATPTTANELSLAAARRTAPLAAPRLWRWKISYARRRTGSDNFPYRLRQVSVREKFSPVRTASHWARSDAAIHEPISTPQRVRGSAVSVKREACHDAFRFDPLD